MSCMKYIMMMWYFIEVYGAQRIIYIDALKMYEINYRYGFWGICFIYGTFFALGGLEAAGKTYDNCEAVRQAVKFFLSIQNEEGGWGESYKSCTREVYIPLSGNHTNLVQTSWAMLGLMSAGQVSFSIIIRSCNLTKAIACQGLKHSFFIYEGGKRSNTLTQSSQVVDQCTNG